MAGKKRVYTEDEKWIALSFLERLHFDFALAAKRAKVPEDALRVFYGEDLLAKRAQAEAGNGIVKPPPQELVRVKLLSEPEPVIQPDFVVPENRLTRPYPPDYLSRPERWPARIEPAPAVADWLRAAIIEPTAPLYRQDDYHLGLADIKVLWTNVPNSRGGNPTWGQIEIPLRLTKNKWERIRQEQQLVDWFGDVPDFLITIDSVFGAASSDRDWCAGCKHELLHAWYRTDKYGLMKWDTNAETSVQTPAWTMRGHDVEEFNQIAREFGIDGCAGKSRAFLEALQQIPTWTDDDIAEACGRS